MAASCRRCSASLVWATQMHKVNVFRLEDIRIPKSAVNLRFSSTLPLAQPAYPEVKQEYPPGSWGSMPPRLAWKWYEKGKGVTEIRSVQERLLKLDSGTERNRYKVSALSSHPRLLAYRQYITKTHVLYGLPDAYKAVPVQVNVAAVQSAVEDVISDECVKLNRSQKSKSVTETHSCAPIDKIMSVLLTHLSLVEPRLYGDQVDRDVAARFSWYRKAPKVIACKAQARDLDEGCIRYTYTDDVSFQIRSEKPLVDVVPLSASLCKGSCPTFDYSPACLAQFAELTTAKQLPGFLYGDPCQYSTTAVLDARPLALLRKNAVDALYHEALVGAGVVFPFGILAGEAYYDGFTQYDDVSHPMTMQAVITDGREFVFSVYQLNTLRLFVDDNANQLRNLCWTSGATPLKLYDDVTSDGKVLGFNRDVLSLLVTFLLRERKTSHVRHQSLPSGELFPYRPRYERWTDMPVLLEGSANIPTAIKYRKGRRSDGRPHGSKKTLLDPITGKRVVVNVAN